MAAFPAPPSFSRFPSFVSTVRSALPPGLLVFLPSLTKAVAAKAAAEPIHAIFDDASDDRRREWASSTKILQSRMARGHPFSPAPPEPAAGVTNSLTLASGPKTVTFRWRTAADRDPADPALEASEGPSDAGA